MDGDVYTALTWIPAGVTPKTIPKQIQVLERNMDTDLPENEAQLMKKYDLDSSSDEDKQNVYNDNVFNDDNIQRTNEEDEDDIIKSTDLFLASCRTDGSLFINLFDIDNNTFYTHRLYELGPPGIIVSSLAWMFTAPNTDGNASFVGITCMGSNNIEFWNMNIAESVQCDFAIENAHNDSISSINWNVIVSNQLLSTSSDNYSKIWDIKTMCNVASYDCGCEVYNSDWNFTGDGNIFCAGTLNGCFVYDTRSGDPQLVVFQASPVGSSQWLKDGYGLLLTPESEDTNQIYYFDMRNPSVPVDLYKGREGNITKIAASRYPEKQIFSSVDSCGVCSLYTINDSSKIELIKTIEVSKEICFSCAFCPDNPFLIGIASNEIAIIDIEEVVVDGSEKDVKTFSIE